MSPPDHDLRGASTPLSRRRLLARLATLGLTAAVGASVTACGGPAVTIDPQKIAKDFLGQAQQATGSAPVPNILRWITPIRSLRPPATDSGTPSVAATPTPLPSPTPGTTAVRDLGWAAMRSEEHTSAL